MSELSYQKYLNESGTNITYEDKCSNCFYYRANECNGVEKLCDDYIRVPLITEEEMANWEKEGDASRYRKKYFRRANNGYSIMNINYM